MMHTEDITLLILSLLIIVVIMVLAILFDRKCYPSTSFKDLVTYGQFFNNPSYDEPVNRFLLSKGGMMIMSLIFMATFLLAGLEHGAV